MIKYDMEKAKHLWREKIRRARKPILEELDIQFMRATEEGTETSVIVDKKVRLRNFPNKVEIQSAKDIEELQKIWDNDLLGDKD